MVWLPDGEKCLLFRHNTGVWQTDAQTSGQTSCDSIVRARYAYASRGKIDCGKLMLKMYNLHDGCVTQDLRVMRVKEAAGSKCYMLPLNRSDSALPEAVLNASAPVGNVCSVAKWHRQNTSALYISDSMSISLWLIRKSFVFVSFITMQNGSNKWITSPPGLEYVTLLRTYHARHLMFSFAFFNFCLFRVVD